MAKVKEVTPVAPPTPYSKPRSKKPKSPSVASFAKFLGSSEKVIRDRALDILEKTLDNSAQHVVEYGSWSEPPIHDPRLPHSDLEKLCKALVYCFWMQDKPLLQEDLADRIVSLVVGIRPYKKSPASHVAQFRTALIFMQALLTAIVREWSGIDRLRIDKFYMLVRRLLRGSLSLVKKLGWTPEACVEYTALLETVVVKPGAPIALLYHFSEIYLDEIDTVCDESDRFPIWPLLAPFNKLAEQHIDKILFQKLVEYLYEPLCVGEHSVLAHSADASDDKDAAQTIQHHLFRLGSMSADDVARKRLYALYRRFKGD